MTSQWQGELDDAQQPAEMPRGFPARIAAAFVILAALMFADATPMIVPDSAAPLRTERPMPSACGAEAVARAQREVLRLRPPPTAVS